jgi:hypothetical protein
MDDNELKIGDRVRLNALGEQCNGGLRTRTGVITGRTRGSGYYVLMDGNKTPSRLHRSFLEADSPPFRSAACAS